MENALEAFPSNYSLTLSQTWKDLSQIFLGSWMLKL